MRGIGHGAGKSIQRGAEYSMIKAGREPAFWFVRNMVSGGCAAPNWQKELESHSFWALETSGKMVNFCLDRHSSLWYYLGVDKSADLKGAVLAKNMSGRQRVPLALLVCTSRCEGFASAF